MGKFWKNRWSHVASLCMWGWKLLQRWEVKAMYRHTIVNQIGGKRTINLAGVGSTWSPPKGN